MRRNLSVAFSILLLLFILGSGPARGEYSVEVSWDEVRVTISSVFQGNITTLPVFSGALVGENSSAARLHFEEAIRERTDGAMLGFFELKVNSTVDSVRYTLVMDVEGITRGGPENFEADLAWRSFNVSEEILVGSQHFNRVGEKYLFPAVKAFTEIPREQTVFRYRINGIPFIPERMLDRVSSFSLMDFTDLSPPLESWRSSFDLSSMTSSWTMTFDVLISIQGTTFDPEGSVDFFHIAAYNRTVRVSAPGIAFGSGDRVFASSSVSIEDVVMVAVVTLTLILSVVTIVLDRLLTSRSLRAGRRRQRR